MARPRQAEIDEKLLDSARRLLAEVGYDELTMEGVAKKAGVGKQALYRRWPTKARLVFAASIVESLPEEVPDTGSLEDDLVVLLRGLVETFDEGRRPAFAGQLSSMIADAEFAEEVIRRFTQPQMEHAMTVWTRALERGDADPAIDGQELLRDLSSAMVMRRIVYHLPVDDDTIRAAVDRACRGCLLPPPDH